MTDVDMKPQVFETKALTVVVNADSVSVYSGVNRINNIEFIEVQWDSKLKKTKTIIKLTRKLHDEFSSEIITRELSKLGFVIID